MDYMSISIPSKFICWALIHPYHCDVFRRKDLWEVTRIRWDHGGEWDQSSCKSQKSLLSPSALCLVRIWWAVSLYRLQEGLHQNSTVLYLNVGLPASTTVRNKFLLFVRHPTFSISVMCCVLRWSVMSNSLRPHGLQTARLFCPWDFPGENTSVGCHFLLQGIFLTQRSKLNHLHFVH